MMTAGTRGGSVSGAMSFDVALVSVAHASNRPGAPAVTVIGAGFVFIVPGDGPAAVTVSGLGLGNVLNTMRSRAGHTGCESTKWVSETSVVGRLGHGAGSTRRLFLTLSVRVGSLSHAWSFSGPVASGLNYANLPGSGAISATVYGHRFGLSFITSRLRSSMTGCEATDWESETSVRCRLGHGAGLSRRLMITVGERSGSLSQRWSTDVTGL